VRSLENPLNPSPNRERPIPTFTTEGTKEREVGEREVGEREMGEREVGEREIGREEGRGNRAERRRRKNGRREEWLCLSRVKHGNNWMGTTLYWVGQP
jgi:hypothetical protein